MHESEHTPGKGERGSLSYQEMEDERDRLARELFEAEQPRED